MLIATGIRNWFHRPRKLKIATEANPLRAIGSITMKKVAHSPAPSNAAASEISYGSVLKKANRKNTVNGRANAT